MVVASEWTLKDNDDKWDIGKGKEGIQCAMTLNSELDGTNPEWDSEESKSHLPFSVCHPKDTWTIKKGFSETH